MYIYVNQMNIQETSSKCIFIHIEFYRVDQN